MSLLSCKKPSKTFENIVVPKPSTIPTTIIEKNNPQLAAFLGISTGYHKRKEEEELSRKETIERMREKTEALRLKNEQQKLTRERNILMGRRADGGGLI